MRNDELVSMEISLFLGIFVAILFLLQNKLTNNVETKTDGMAGGRVWYYSELTFFFFNFAKALAFSISSRACRARAQWCEYTVGMTHLDVVFYNFVVAWWDVL